MKCRNGLWFVLLLFWVACTEPAPQEATLTPSLSLIFPPDGGHTGVNTPLVLRWADPAPLPEDQLYAVRLARAGEPLQDLQWTADTQYDASGFATDPGEYTWEVLRIQLNAAGGYDSTLTSSPAATFARPADAADLMARLGVNVTPQADCPAPLRQPLSEVIDYEIQGEAEALAADGSFRFLYGDVGFTVFPLHTAWYGQGALLEWCNRDDPLGLHIAARQADWLVGYAEWGGEVARVPYGYAAGEYGAPRGWWSGLAQAEIIRFLGYMQAIAPQPSYAGLIDGLLNAYETPMAEGGVMSLAEDGEHVWYEEYAHGDIAPAHVLNGHMQTVTLLAAYADLADDPRAASLADAGQQTLQRYLPGFDGESISYYAQNVGGQTISSNREHYAHGVHISSALALYERYAAPIFLEYALRWMHDTWPPYDMTSYRNQLAAPTRLDEPLERLPTRSGIPLDTEAVQALVFDLDEARPVASLAYNVLLGDGGYAYPTAAALDISQDGEDWQPVAEVRDLSHPAHLFRLTEPTEARYLRLRWDAWQNPGTVRVGMVRVDGPDYWARPILVDSSGSAALRLAPEEALYLDLQAERQPEAITLAGETDAGRVSVTVSADLATWQPLLADIAWTAGEALALPEDAPAWRYARLEFQHTTDVHLTGVDVR